MNNRVRMEEALENAPTLPVVAIKLASLLDRGSYVYDELDKVIGLDHVLEAHVIKAMNSSFYRISQEVRTIRDAVDSHGEEEVTALALGFAMKSYMLMCPVKCPLGQQTLLRHSLACAFVASRMGGDRFKSHKLFLCGLLHDIGKTVICGKMSDEEREAIEIGEGGLSLLKVEQKFFGYDHTDVGGRYAQRMALPDYLSASIRWHCAPEEAGDHKQLATIVCVADAFCRAQGFNLCMGDMKCEVDQGQVRSVGLGEVNWEEMAMSLMDYMAKSEVLYKLKAETVQGG